jgi:serine phosphatase RsbU (regulator of sigma subunit)
VAEPAGESRDVLIGPRSTRPDRRIDVYLLLAATFVAVAAYIGALLLEVLPPRGLTVAFFAATPIFAAFALAVLATRGRAEQDERLSWVSAGLAAGIVAMVLQVISFPAVAPDGGPLGTSDDSSAFLYLLFHLTFGAAAIAGALGAPIAWRVPSVVVGCVLAVLIAIDAIPLPELIRGGTVFTPLLIWVEIVLAAVIAGATMLWVVRVGRSAAALNGWVGVALSLSFYDVALNAISGERFEAVWWGSLSLRVATYVALAGGALATVLTRLRDAESYSSSELDRRESQLRNSLAVTAGLLSSAEDLSRAITSEQVADTLSANARAAAGATYASVVIGRRGEPLRLLGADGYDPAMRRRLTTVDWDLGLPPPQVLALGQPMFIGTHDEIQQRFPRVSELPMGRAGALATLPINVWDEPIGVLSVWDTAPRRWSENHRRLLAGLAAQGGQAIARAQAYEQQATAARTLQASLLPSRLPEPSRLDLAARYQPAEDGVLVGGDWYDCLVLGDHLVALIVGDVMGKGLHAAAQMGQIRMAVRSVAALDPSPSAVLKALDELNIELGIDEIVTMAYVLVDTTLGRGRVARAGHLPPALAHPEGKVELIDAGSSAPLGAPHGERVEAEFSLPVGGLLVLYTDGLVEDRATGLDRGMDQLILSLETMAPYDQPTGELAARLLQDCSVDRGRDDIALLMARYT